MPILPNAVLDKMEELFCSKSADNLRLWLSDIVWLLIWDGFSKKLPSKDSFLSSITDRLLLVILRCDLVSMFFCEGIGKYLLLDSCCWYRFWMTRALNGAFNGFLFSLIISLWECFKFIRMFWFCFCSDVGSPSFFILVPLLLLLSLFLLIDL